MPPGGSLTARGYRSEDQVALFDVSLRAIGRWKSESDQMFKALLRFNEVESNDRAAIRRTEMGARRLFQRNS